MRIRGLLVVLVAAIGETSAVDDKADARARLAAIEAAQKEVMKQYSADLDPDGVIRHRDLRGEELDRAVAALLAEISPKNIGAK